MTKYKCGDDEDCGNGLSICCGQCQNKCKWICWFFEETPDGNFEECPMLIILEEGTEMSKTEHIAILTKYVESKQLKIPDANKLMEELLFIDSQYNCLRPSIKEDNE